MRFCHEQPSTRAQEADDLFDGRSKQHWRALAADAMTVANLTTDVPSRIILLNIAAAYERLADRAEKLPSVLPQAMAKVTD
jgi:hypothetical protein